MQFVASPHVGLGAGLAATLCPDQTFAGKNLYASWRSPRESVVAASLPIRALRIYLKKAGTGIAILICTATTLLIKWPVRHYPNSNKRNSHKECKEAVNGYRAET